MSARWPGASDDSLHHVDLDIRPGERVLVVGSSGSGKTTLAHVLVRFLDARGSFTIGGVPVADLVPDVLRHRLVLSYEALSEGLSADQIVLRIMAKVPPPPKPLAHEKQAA